MNPNNWMTAVSANWNTPGDWSTGNDPVATNEVTIDVAGAYTISLTTSIDVDSITIGDTPGMTAAGLTEVIALLRRP